MTHESLLKLLHRKAEEHGSWTKLAEALDISPQYLHDCKEGRRRPGKALLTGLGLRAVTEYRSIPASAKGVE